MKPVYNYWNGCSTGGRQGYLLAQELGSELDGILAAAPAIYWTRFQTAHWDEHNRSFDWQTVSLAEYPDVTQDGSRNIADVTDTFKPLDEFKGHGGKLLTWVGGNDQFIYPRGVINYYRAMAVRYSRFGRFGEPDFGNLRP